MIPAPPTYEDGSGDPLPSSGPTAGRLRARFQVRPGAFPPPAGPRPHLPTFSSFSTCGAGNTSCMIQRM